MKSDANLDPRLACVKQVLLDFIGDLLRSESCATLTPDALYSRGVAALTEALLQPTEVRHREIDEMPTIIDEKLRSSRH